MDTLPPLFCHAAIRVADASAAGEARRLANRLAESRGLDETTQANAAIVATELAMNLAKYAPGGEILIRWHDGCGAAGLEFLSIDRGPGLANVGQSMEDGYSTGGSAGTGLGAVRRLSTEFDIFSMQPGGTIVISRVLGPARQPVGEKMTWGVVNRPAQGEIVSGDSWRIGRQADEISVMIADGLGHGIHASEAAEVAGRLFDENRFPTLTDFVAVADRRMRGTRGAALAIAHVHRPSAKLNYAGVGNIAGSLRSPPSAAGRGLVSHNGTVGAEMRKVERLEYDCPGDSVLVMHSDGLRQRWNLTAYPGVTNRHPAVMAALLYRDFTRGRDDVTVCVVRISA